MSKLKKIGHSKSIHHAIIKNRNFIQKKIYNDNAVKKKKATTNTEICKALEKLLRNKILFLQHITQVSL